MMRHLIMDIFDKVNKDIPNLIETECNISDEVEKIMETLEEMFTPEQYEKLGEVVFKASNISERRGFELGVKYIVKLLIECVS